MNLKEPFVVMETMTDLNSAWDTFLMEEEDGGDTGDYVPPYLSFEPPAEPSADVPKCSDIYISTKTKIAYLNRKVDLADLFWDVVVLHYHEPREGVIKKQMKFISATKDELAALQARTAGASHLDEFVLTSIDNPESARIKFKDVRKVSIGVSKKDILSYRCKRKSAFYNCFVLIMRLFHEGAFHEVHIKVFNTGKLEIPGIKDNDMLIKVLDKLVEIFRTHLQGEVLWTPDIYTVLINSNFNCGFYINRARLFEIIQFKYELASVYDPCSYPGIQCKFFYDTRLAPGDQTGRQPTEPTANVKKVSFMIFRTGSVLIVGKCDEDELRCIYGFLRDLLCAEHAYIAEGGAEIVQGKAEKPRKLRKKIVLVS
jgi:TATA-box binding protein (TBP) (component of TFIID and TFIIIB)